MIFGSPPSIPEMKGAHEILHAMKVLAKGADLSFRPVNDASQVARRFMDHDISGAKIAVGKNHW